MVVWGQIKVKGYVVAKVGVVQPNGRGSLSGIQSRSMKEGWGCRRDNGIEGEKKTIRKG